jgi:hypothetical protein
MPQIVAAVLIGAGIAAGVKWIAREIARAAQGGRVGHGEPSPQPVTSAPKDLGALEWDPKTGVYRPSRKR